MSCNLVWQSVRLLTIAGVNHWQDLLRVKLHTRTLLHVVSLVTGIMFQAKGGIAHVAPGSSLSPQSAKASRGTKAASAAPHGKSLLCPAFNSASVQSPLQTRHHEVVLSWKAPPSNLSDDKDLLQGYCVYRSMKQNDASPKLINSIPFAGTSCADDLVADHQTYYYVVVAISAEGRTSSFSNEAIAVIPGKKQSSVFGGSYPLCRKGAGSKRGLRNGGD